ncbi:hypothetical protein ACFLTH_15300 [Bacteroidota bacterium]
MPEKYGITGFGDDVNEVTDINSFISQWLATLQEQFAKGQGTNIDILGQSGFLRELLQGGITKGMPFKDQFRQQAFGDINTSFDQSSTALNQMLAGTGNLRSGAAQAAQAGMAGQRGSALNQANVALNQQDIDYRQNAISQLLGIETGQAGLDLASSKFDWQKLMEMITAKQSQGMYDLQKKYGGLG